jgi:hypothetical protein
MLTVEQNQNLINLTEENIYSTVLLRYKVLRLRSKISFCALYYKMNIRELFHYVILKCHQEQQDDGTINRAQRLRDSFHPFYLLYVGKSFDVRNFKNGSIKIIELNTKEKMAKSKPSQFLKATTAIERDREQRDKMSEATNLLVRKNFDDLINKDKCVDVFKDIKDHQEQIPVSSQDWVRLKMKRCGY